MSDNQDEIEGIIPIKQNINGVEVRFVPVDKLEAMEKELKELRHHRDTTVGLWATDKDPNDILHRAKDCSIYSIDIQTFNELFFQIK